MASLATHPGEIERAIAVLTAAGAFFNIQVKAGRSLTLEQVEERIGLGRLWITRHLAEFPGAWRVPANGANGGRLRIPERDVEAFIERQRINKG